MRFRLFGEKDFGNTDGWCRYEGGEGLLYPPEFWESNESFRRRVEQFPEGCRACVNEDDEVIGYMFCHPWVKGSVVPLDCRNLKLPENPDCFYIHDIAVLTGHRRKGIARAFLDMAILLAKQHGFECIHGVAVMGSEAYWVKQGFRVTSEIEYGKGHKGKVIVLHI